jgi:hypothetical protein
MHAPRAIKLVRAVGGFSQQHQATIADKVQ